MMIKKIEGLDNLPLEEQAVAARGIVQMLADGKREHHFGVFYARRGIDDTVVVGEYEWSADIEYDNNDLTSEEMKNIGPLLRTTLGHNNPEYRFENDTIYVRQKERDNTTVVVGRIMLNKDGE